MTDTNDPTPEEVARAKRWAAMQVPPVTLCYHEYCVGTWDFANLPSFARWRIVGSGTWDDGSGQKAWSALALALRPIFASVAGVILEEFAEGCRNEAGAAHLKEDRWDAGYRQACNNCEEIAAAAIRGLS